MMRWFFICIVMSISTMVWANEVDLPPRGEGPIAFDVDVCSFRWNGAEGFEEITLRFPVAQFSFEQKDATTFVARYKPSLRVLNNAGEVVQQVEAESQMTAESLEATTDVNRQFLDMVQVKLPPGQYRGELTLSDLATGRSGVAVFQLDVPAYDPSKLGLSDLYLAAGFNPPNAGKQLAIFEKDGRIVVPNPGRQYTRGTPLLFYFEVYHLGYQAHDVLMEVLDRYGHIVWRDERSFAGYRGDVNFAEGISLGDLLPGIYSLRVTVNAGREKSIVERKFQIEGAVPAPLAEFDTHRMETARVLLAQFGDQEKANFFDGLDRVERARFTYGFWLEKNPIVARAYYGPRLGYGWLEASAALLKGIGLGSELAKRVDQAFAARLAKPDTVMARLARDVFEVIVEREPDDLLAKAAVGYAYFAGGDLPFGERTFRDVNAKGGVLPEVYNGMGLAYMGRKKWNEAQSAFDQALTLRPDWPIAKSNVELARFLSGKRNWIGRLDTLLTIVPQHPDWWYAKGRLREQMGEWQQAERAYARQAAVNPMHGRARFDLARVWFRQERYAQAAAVWLHLAETQPTLRDEIMDPLLSAYLKTGDTGGAQAVMGAYLRSMDENTRALMQDIRLVASVEELGAYEALPPEARSAYERSFWQRRDPTPVTSGNERLVEHYRRVLHAMTHFSSGKKPWDKRGEIYIRYGPPAHVSKSTDVRYETDGDVVKVKERLLMSLTPEAHKEIMARMGRLRTSTRDVQYQGDDAGDLVVADFESIDYELNPNRIFFGGGADRNDGNYYDDQQDSHRDRDAGMTNIRGYPIFPIDGGTSWEYWIYPDVANGIEVVFTALDSRGGFDFPEMPQGRVLSQFNQSQWMTKRPDRVVASAIRKQAEIYRTRTNDLEFHFDAVDFRGQNDRSRLEVYYGVPLSALVSADRTQGVVERGIALFDSTWTPVFRKVRALPFSVTDPSQVTGGALVVDELALNVKPGTYHLGVEVRDRERNLMGAYTRKIDVEAYSSVGLGLSDIEMAGSVVEDPDAKVKGGYKVVPMPSATYRPGQPVTIYYEVYGLAQDEFGQTHYQMEYQISPKKGKPIAVTILRAIGELLGIEEKKVVTISYEQKGKAKNEHIYLEIDVSGSESGRYELQVTVTDLKSGKKVSKETLFGIAR